MALPSYKIQAGLNGSEYTWGDYSFNHRKLLKIDSSQVSGTSDFTNFPVLIELFDTDLKTDVQANGNDIAFLSTDGKTQYDHEIDVFDQNYNSTHARLLVWVRIPTLSATSDTPFFMYYGNSNMKSIQNSKGVWSDYQAVYHFEGNVADSSKYGRATEPMSF